MRGATKPCLQGWLPLRISIHAPLAGCDIVLSARLCVMLNFNPRTPCGVRPIHVLSFGKFVPFQSTHPLRGATARQVFHDLMLCISIHAPLAGCDPPSVKNKLNIVSFQSTHPLRGATGALHARLNNTHISIHAPLAGCDCGRVRKTSITENFNPRTPCGVRQHESRKRVLQEYFNPRTPCGVRQSELAHLTIL